jgi:5,10-methylenetetrahydromethanopterin reductase
LRSAPVLLAAAAPHTRRIQLGTCVLNPYSAHPAEIAMTAATLQELTGGRFLLGLAAGAETFLAWAGIPRPAPLARTRAAVSAIRTLLAGGRPREDAGAGAGWLEGAHLRIPPAPTPIYVGAMSPRMLALAGEIADGALPLLFPPEHYPVAAAHIAAGLSAAGRDASDFDLPACIWCSIDENGGRARRALAEKVAYYGPSFSEYLLARAGLSRGDFAGIEAAAARGDRAAAADLVTPRMLSLGIAGAAEEVGARCEGLVAMGARHLSFGPPLGPDPERAVEALARDVLPPLRSRAAGA